jgi:hypothetical protein
MRLGPAMGCAAVYAAAMVPASAASPPAAQLKLLDREAWPLARCLDGSPPAYYFRPATSAAGAKKWFIHHMGGDFCGYGDSWGEWIENCRQRSTTGLGSSKWYVEHQPKLQLEAAGMDFFDENSTRNPLMHDWNWVYLVYCDGHYYAGANTTRTFAPVPSPPAPMHAPATPGPPPVELFFRGRYNVEGTLGTLAKEENLSDATDVVIGGCSSVSQTAVLLIARLRIRLAWLASHRLRASGIPHIYEGSPMRRVHRGAWPYSRTPITSAACSRRRHGWRAWRTLVTTSTSTRSPGSSHLC